MGRFSIFIIVIVLTAVSCSLKNMETENDTVSSLGELVPPGDVISLVCGPQADCLFEICGDPEKCPLSIALSNKTVFDFVKTYSECEGCNTQELSMKQPMRYKAGQLNFGCRKTATFAIQTQLRRVYLSQ